jgi:hypothetical protein
MNRCPIATLTVLILLPKGQDRYLMFVRWSEEDRSLYRLLSGPIPGWGVCMAQRQSKRMRNCARSWMRR